MKKEHQEDPILKGQLRTRPPKEEERKTLKREPSQCIDGSQGGVWSIGLAGSGWPEAH